MRKEEGGGSWRWSLDVCSGSRLASSVTPPSLALGLPFGISGITGDERAGVTLAASLQGYTAALFVFSGSLAGGAWALALSC